MYSRYSRVFPVIAGLQPAPPEAIRELQRYSVSEADASLGIHGIPGIPGIPEYTGTRVTGVTSRMDPFGHKVAKRGPFRALRSQNGVNQVVLDSPDPSHPGSGLVPDPGYPRIRDKSRIRGTRGEQLLTDSGGQE